jgi:16S rRNA A1518/A1519 N6-dimethyltransferase RsmA/KsgA/DIM1 with predicted DNA glycosylase/AP lyase activity
MLRNALANAADLNISRDAVDTLLDAAGIDSSRRAETLSLDEYLTLATTLTMKEDSE